MGPLGCARGGGGQRATAGNHDGTLQGLSSAETSRLFGATHVLCGGQAVTVGGLRFWGLPWSPRNRSPNSAWQLMSERELQDHAAALTRAARDGGVDVVVTHASTRRGGVLRDAVAGSGARLRVCGHFHASHGARVGRDGSLTACASVCDDLYTAKQSVIVVDVERRGV